MLLTRPAGFLFHTNASSPLMLLWFNLCNLHDVYFNELPPEILFEFLWKSLCAVSTPLGSEIIKIFHFGVMVWVWRGRHFEHFAVKNKMLITSVYIVQYASNFVCMMRVPPWTHSHTSTLPQSLCHLLATGNPTFLPCVHLNKLLLQILSTWFNVVWILPRPVTCEVMKSFHFRLKHNEMCIASKYIVLYAPNPKYFIRVPASTCPNAFILSWS